jgi:transaldolase
MEIKIFADGANLDDIKRLNNDPLISGMTTNPALIRKAGISNYEDFIKEVVSIVKYKPVSFEVIADDFDEMIYQAKKIAKYGNNIYVKIPVTDTKKNLTTEVLEKLSISGIKLNVTAIMTLDQVKSVCRTIGNTAPSIISVFAGRISDTQRDIVPIMEEAKRFVESYDNQELLWASTRSIDNIRQAEKIGVDIITITPDILKKLGLKHKNLEDYSLETVQEFYRDAKKAGYTL